MNRYERTWPLSLAAIALGGAIGFSLLGPHHLSFDSGHSADELQALVGAPAGPELDPAPVTPVEHAAPVSEATRRIELKRLVGMPTDEILDVLRTSPVTDDRRNAAILLGTAGRPGEVLGALMIALRTDQSPEVRFTVAESLGRLGQPMARGPLHLAATLDEDLRVREAAVVALGKLAHPESVPVLAEVLATDLSQDVRVRAALALLEMDDSEARFIVQDAMASGLAEEIRSAWTRELLEQIEARSGR